MIFDQIFAYHVLAVLTHKINHINISMMTTFLYIQYPLIEQLILFC